MDYEKLIYSNLLDMMEDFFHLTHIRISFWDASGKKCFMAPASGNSAFCCELRKIPSIDALCQQCDAQALHNARNNEDKLYRFHCMAGLNEYVYPVRYQKRLLGYFMYGQARTQDTDAEDVRQRNELYLANHLDPELMSTLYLKLPITTESAMLAAGRMMANIAKHAYLTGILSDYSAPFSIRLRLYLENEYMNPITLDSACQFFNVSRSHLCHAIQKEMQSTFSKLLNRRRIESVCKCLETGQSLAEAAINSGFQSDNYMIRVFKQVMGCTPMQYLHHLRVQQIK